jgi:hypothetical protein
MRPGFRKFALTAHVTTSVGWFGAVGAFLCLAITGLRTTDAHLMRATYLGMQLVAFCVIVPLSLASPLTGLVQSLGTHWGLFRHYWVLVKFLITVPCTIILLLHMQAIRALAQATASTTLNAIDVPALQVQMVVNAAVALVALLVATALSVYKPRGLTPYGARSENRQDRSVLQSGDFARRPTFTQGKQSLSLRWVYVLGFVLIVIAAHIVILHISGGGLGGHTH